MQDTQSLAVCIAACDAYADTANDVFLLQEN